MHWNPWTCAHNRWSTSSQGKESAFFGSYAASVGSGCSCVASGDEQQEHECAASRVGCSTSAIVHGAAHEFFNEPANTVGVSDASHSYSRTQRSEK
jgi:hypothetical protein